MALQIYKYCTLYMNSPCNDGTETFCCCKYCNIHTYIYKHIRIYTYVYILVYVDNKFN